MRGSLLDLPRRLLALVRLVRRRWCCRRAACGLAALFLALLAGQVRERRLLLAALGGAAVALAMVPLVPPGVPIVAAGVVCLAGLRS